MKTYKVVLTVYAGKTSSSVLNGDIIVKKGILWTMGITHILYHILLNPLKG